ncbi:MAG: hypothetical protein WD095_01525 [Candidatus Paceibacterota bacterium]
MNSKFILVLSIVPIYFILQLTRSFVVDGVSFFGTFILIAMMLIIAWIIVLSQPKLCEGGNVKKNKREIIPMDNFSTDFIDSRLKGKYLLEKEEMDHLVQLDKMAKN